MIRHLSKSSKSQRGVVLLALFMVLFMLGATAFIVVMNNNVVDQDRDENTMGALRAAKDVLISYAVFQGDYYGGTGAGPGHLMCPDIDGDGLEDANCPGNSLGRLPTSIVLPSGAIFPVSDYNSGNDQQIWYALSNRFRRSPFRRLSSTTGTTITVDGQGGIAAVLIAPEQAVAGQVRPSNAVADYLEAANTAAPAFVTSNPLDPTNFNDRVLVITFNEIMSPTTARVAEVIKIQLDAYRVLRGRYPRRRDFDDVLNGIGGGGGGGKKGGKKGGGGGALPAMPDWFFNNRWDRVANYRRLDNNNAEISFDACNITYTVTFGVNSIAKTGSQC